MGQTKNLDRPEAPPGDGADEEPGQKQTNKTGMKNSKKDKEANSFNTRIL